MFAAGSLQTAKKIAACIERDLQTGLCIGIVPGILEACTQGETLDGLHESLKEVIELCLEEMDPGSLNEIPEFVGIQQIEVGR